MSIASVNPTLAYFLSALLVSVVILATQFYVALIWDDSLAITGIVGLTVLQFLQIYAHARAYKFWKKRYAEAKANRFSELLFARKTVFHPVFDFFISKTVTMDLNLIAVKWAPLWEGLFPIAGCYVLPLFVTLLTKSISDWMNMDIADIRPVLLIGLVASILVGFFGNTWLFASFHEYKFFEVGKLKKKMDGLSRHYLLVKIGRDTPQKNQLAEYVSVCRQLWAITGHDFYKKRAEEVQDWIGV